MTQHYSLYQEKGGAGISDTPLSDLISQHFEIGDAESYGRFIEAFRRSNVGVIATGGPDEAVGKVTSTDANPIQISTTQSPDGRIMILVFADPPAFIRRFGRRFNAEMNGEGVLKTVKSDPACEGVLINSAVSESAIIIDRGTAISALESRTASEDLEVKPWWKFW